MPVVRSDAVPYALPFNQQLVVEDFISEESTSDEKAAYDMSDPDDHASRKELTQQFLVSSASKGWVLCEWVLSTLPIQPCV